MNTSSQHNSPLHVSRLTPCEAAHPHKVFEAFFDFATVAEAHACLDQWLLAALHTRDDEEQNHLHLYRHLERLIEASWLIHNQYLKSHS